jgi:tRNA(Ile)-lysidine synthase
MKSLNIFNHILSFWELHFPKNISLLIAVSGGPDSVALTHLMLALREPLQLKELGIVHVNHQLRGTGSDEDERFVRDLARQLNVPIYCKRLTGKEIDQPGIEQWAREERYNFLHKTKQNEQFDYIATGHTADDQAETVIMRLMRGTGIRGLRGILPKRDDSVIRPLLSTRRFQLIDWLKKNNYLYRIDPSNEDTTLTRNWVRHEIVPRLQNREGSVVEHLCTSADHLQKTYDVVGDAINKWIDRFVFISSEYRFLIKKEGFREPAIAMEGLRYIFSVFHIPVSAMHIHAVLKNKNRNSGTFLLPGGWRYYPQRGTITFNVGRAEQKHLRYRHILSVPGTTICDKTGTFSIVETVPPASFGPDEYSVSLDYDCTGNHLFFRSWEHGEPFWPLGANQPVAVRDFLAKQKIPVYERERIGVVGNERQIVWIPGIRIAHPYRIRPKTKRIISLSFKPYCGSP